MIYRSKAPLRISFAGGGTDVSPYFEEKGGMVLSTTIDKYAYASLIPREDDRINVKVLGYDISGSFSRKDALEYDGKMDLVKSVLKKMDPQSGCDLYLQSDVTPGSGLGSSSTMIVALLGVFSEWMELVMTDYEVAELAYKIEREELKIAGGKQDQYAAVFGGFNFIEFKRDATIVNPLHIEPELLNELEYSLLMCYTGKTRLSGNIIEEQVNSYKGKEEKVLDAFKATKEICIKMKDVLLKGDISDFGSLLYEAWLEKKKFASKVTNSQIDALYEIAMESGAIGGKVLGAGGGGHLLFCCPFEKKHQIAKSLEEAGGKMVDFSFEGNGLQTWKTKKIKEEYYEFAGS